MKVFWKPIHVDALNQKTHEVKQLAQQQMIDWLKGVLGDDPLELDYRVLPYLRSREIETDSPNAWSSLIHAILNHRTVITWIEGPPDTLKNEQKGVLLETSDPPVTDSLPDPDETLRIDS